MELKVLDINGKAKGAIEVDEALFNADYNEALIHQVVVAQLANKRQGTHAALTRSEIRGGHAKPFRQKGTGQARQGSIVGPHQTGGGVAFAKKPRDFSQKINKTMKKAAFYSAVSEKIRDGKVIIIDELTLTEAKTKLVANAAKALKLTGKSLFVTEEYDATAVLAARNIPSVTLEEARLLNTYSVVANSNLVLTVGAVRKLEEAAK